MRIIGTVGLMLLSCVLVVAPAYGGGGTIDKVVTKALGGGMYSVTVYGTLTKLTNLGGGYEQWGSVATTIGQTGKTPYYLASVSVTAPSFTADGSYVMTGNVSLNAGDPNWTATSIISWKVDNDPNHDKSMKPTQAFTIP